MTPFEFLIPKRPLSLQAKRRNLQLWKNFVRNEAAKTWLGPALQVGSFQLTLIYLCDEAPPDIDNIIKPIQDALIGLILIDDSLIADVDSHRRFLDDDIDITHLPGPLLTGLTSRQECVYVRLGLSRPLEEYL